MDDISRSIIEAARPSLGARAHQLYLDFIHLGIALIPGRVYKVHYHVRARHLWENEGAISSEGSGTNLEEAITACAAAHQKNNHTTNDWQVAWSVTMTVTHGSWRRILVVSPDLYHHLVPGGQLDGGCTSTTDTLLLRQP